MNFPSRKLFGIKELYACLKVFLYAWANDVDFGFQGHYEEELCRKFSQLIYNKSQFADGLSSGTAAVYVALKSLGLEENDEVIISPVTNPGSVMPIILVGCNLVVPDCKPNSLNLDISSLERCISDKTKAVVLTHLNGFPANSEKILDLCSAHSIKLIEDCSQSVCAKNKDGSYVGSKSDIAIYSTMYSKTLATGGCGALAVTKSENLYNMIRSHADRGKPFHDLNYDRRATNKYLFSAFNFNMDELSAAIGISILERLPSIVYKRRLLAQFVKHQLASESRVFYVLEDSEIVDRSSPFCLTVYISEHVSEDQVMEIKKQISKDTALPFNTNFRDFVYLWEWLQDERVRFDNQYNSRKHYKRCINLLYNENFTKSHMTYIINSLVRIESNYV